MKYLVSTLSWVVILVSVTVMIGWFFEIDSFTRIVPGFVTMKFSTALSFFLSGLVLFFTNAREKHASDWADIVLPSATFIILILMGTTLLSVLLGFRSGIENLFVQESADAILTTVPGRPSLGTMVAFLLISFLGIWAMSPWHSRRYIYLCFGTTIVLLGAIALIGYSTANPLLYFVISDLSTAMAVHTAVLFVLLGVGYGILFSDLRSTIQSRNSI